MSRSTVAPLPVQLSLFAPAAVPALAVSAPLAAATLSDRALDALAESWGDSDADLDNVILFPTPSPSLRRDGRVGRRAPRSPRG